LLVAVRADVAGHFGCSFPRTEEVVKGCLVVIYGCSTQYRWLHD